jgi:predicted ester cyclase
MVIDDVIADGDRVVTHFTFTGTHEGELMGVRPTGKEVSVTGTGVFHVVDGKIVEWTYNLDYLGMFQQLEAIPPLGQGDA